MAENPKESAAEAVREIATQIITLCTSLIAAGVAFAKIGTPLPHSHFTFFIALVMFGVAILFGILTLMTTTSVLANGSFDVATGKLVRVCGGAQIVCFMIGLVLLVILAYQLLYPANSPHG
jgi:hypothetical protein